MKIGTKNTEEPFEVPQDQGEDFKIYVSKSF